MSGWQQFGMICIDAYLLCHPTGYFLTVTGQHHRLHDTQRLQTFDGLLTVRLHLVVDDNMTGIDTIDVHMDDGTVIIVTAVPLRTNSIHHLGITHADGLTAYLGTNTLAGQLFHVGD